MPVVWGTSACGQGTSVPKWTLLAVTSRLPQPKRTWSVARGLSWGQTLRKARFDPVIEQGSEG